MESLTFEVSRGMAVSVEPTPRLWAAMSPEPETEPSALTGCPRRRGAHATQHRAHSAAALRYQELEITHLPVPTDSISDTVATARQ